MKVGNYTLYSIETSQFSLDGGAMFGIIPKTLWEKEAPADEYNRIQMVTRSLLVVSNERKIIIDTGNGDKWDDKNRSRYNIDLDKINLSSSLEKYGFIPADITDVFCTHLHFDHAGGNTSIEDGKIVPTFPNATYWIHQDNWDLANSPSEKDRGSYLAENWSVLAENGMIEYVTDRPGHDLRYAMNSSKLRKASKWEPEFNYENFERGLEKTGQRVENYLN